MYFNTPGLALLRRGVTASAVMLGVAACSRSDRSSNGRDTTQVQTGSAVTADTGSTASSTTTPAPTSASSQTSPAADTGTMAEHPMAKSTESGRPRTLHKNVAQDSVSGYRAMAADSGSASAPVSQSSATDTAHLSQDTVAVGDSSHIGKTGSRLKPTATSEQANADTLSNQTESERVRPPEDSSETVGVVSGDSGTAAVSSSDTTGGAPEMARDTTSSLAQADTAAPEQSDTSAQAAPNSSAVQVQEDTTQETEMAQQAPVDSSAPVQAQVDTAQADTSSASQPSEVAPQEARIRPPEDSTELHGNVTHQNNQADVASGDQQADSAAVGGAAVQAGNMATGAEAVQMVSREGRRCTVVNDPAERRDLASSPVTLNPCGTGTMTLPRAQAEE